MNIGECVGYINVLDLTQNEKLFTEVLVVEVFTPSFFWIQLRQNQRTFKKFMNELQYVYKKIEQLLQCLSNLYS